MTTSGKGLPQGTVLRGKEHEYRIERILGQGTFGITYLAYIETVVGGELGEVKAKIQFAVKEFFMRDINGREGSSVTHSDNDGLFGNYRRKFAREAQNLGKLHHSKIVKVVETFDANNTSYIVMEYCEGGSLDGMIAKKGRLSQDEALRYFAQIADALAFMHSRKMLHLDLKPGNIMLRGNGDVVLIDFGLSKQYNEDGEPESSTTVGAGTPGYAPIEQANYREGHGFPVTMDVYALGATLFKMLVGERPPMASDILTGFPDATLRSCGVDEKVIAAICRAMRPIPAERYQSVSEFANAIADEATMPLIEQIPVVLSIDDDGTPLHARTPAATPAPTPGLTPVITHAPIVITPLQHKSSKKYKSLWLAIPTIAVVINFILLLLLPPQWHWEQGVVIPAVEDMANVVAVSPDTAVVSDSAAVAQAEVSVDGQGVEEEYEVPADTKESASIVADMIRKDQQNGGESVEDWFKKGTKGLDGENYVEAERWLRKAAEKGHTRAQTYLGDLYYYGSLPTNYSEARKWYLMAAEKGDPDAQTSLGTMYHNGKGVVCDLSEAMKWYRKAANQGHEYAQLDLGLCYTDKRLGSQVNYQEAFRYFKMAAQKGLPQAQYMLGSCYVYGTGTERNAAEGKRWLKKAADQGNEDAKQLLDMQIFTEELNRQLQEE